MPLSSLVHPGAGQDDICTKQTGEQQPTTPKRQQQKNQVQPQSSDPDCCRLAGRRPVGSYVLFN